MEAVVQFCLFTAMTAAVSSNLGMVTTLTGATLALLPTKTAVGAITIYKT